MSNNSTLLVGLDLGDRHSDVCILDREGELIEESRIPTGQSDLRRKFAGLPSFRIALRVGSHARRVSRLLEGDAQEILAANARQLRRVYRSPARPIASILHPLAMLRQDPGPPRQAKKSPDTKAQKRGRRGLRPGVTGRQFRKMARARVSFCGRCFGRASRAGMLPAKPTIHGLLGRPFVDLATIRV